MSLTADVRSALSLLERLQGTLRGCEEPRMRVQCTNDLNTLISALHNPVLNRIVTIQDSLHDLKKELSRHPSLLPTDFDISPRRGELALHFPSEDGEEIYPQQRVIEASPRVLESDHSDLATKPASVLNSYDAHPLDMPEPHTSPQRHWAQGRGLSDDVDDEHDLIRDDLVLEGTDGGDGPRSVPLSITNATLDGELKKLINVAAEGRQIHHIQLYKPEGTSLGFSVVGLKSEQRGDLGIYVQEIQSTGIAAKDGRLRDGDQILAIDGQVLDSYISHQQAIAILQKANKLVDLVVARAPAGEIQKQQEDQIYQETVERFEQHPLHQLEVNRRELEPPPLQTHYTTTHIVPPSTESRTSNMLNTEWAQVEVIHLVNDGSGLGFGIIGGRSTGVVVKTILPGGVADREGRLRSGDHILQIGEVNLRGMGSDQVASVLRQAGSHVRLVVARPVESASPDFQIGRNAPIVETRVLNDPDELDRHLNLISNGFPSSSVALTTITANGGPASSSNSSASTVPAGVPANGHSDYINGGDTEFLTVNNQIASTSAAVAVVTSDGPLTSGGSMLPDVMDEVDDNTVAEGGEGMSLADLPEMENIDLDLAKDHQGLGITIAGYVCEREELSGIFVKSINAGSAADRSGHVQVNDQIVEVDGRRLIGLSNHAAVEVLRSTGQRVRLRLARYLRGPKFEQLQQAIANSELRTTPTTPNPPRAPLGDLPSSEAIRTALGELDDDVNMDRSHESLVEAYNPNMPSSPPPAQPHTSVITIKDSHEKYNVRTVSSTDGLQGSTKLPNEVRLDDIELLIDSDYTGDLNPSVESAIVRKWSRIVGPDLEIVVAQLRKFEKGGGLGISLEGTVDVEDGREVRPHHYIRSILPDGPVGRDGRLRSGDELLEVNNQKLLGLNHVEVVTILKELPQAVRIVCGRRVSGSTTPIHSAEVSREAFGARDVLGGSLQNLIPSSERLVKAKSDGSLASSTNNVNSESNSFTKVKSRSLEPLTGLAMWSRDPQHIELLKGERGLGFSILDYQDPLNPQETVIVIRSLVPGGVAEKDGRLIPGDRLVGVNGIPLEKASLDEAVAALKGAPKGPVVISVAKPISVLESPGQLDLILGDLGSSEAGSDVTDVEVKYDDDYTQEQMQEIRRRRKANDSVISTASSGPPALPTSEPPSVDRDASVLVVPVASERLIGGSNSSSAASSAGGELIRGRVEGGRMPPFHSKPQTVYLSSSASPAVAPSSGEDESSPRGSPIPHPRTVSLVHTLPKKLERVVNIRKDADQLGVNIEVVDKGINGVVVSSLVRGGAVHRDGRIHAGDLIVSVNSESMRNITNSQARAILRRTQLVNSDISIAFIPGQEAAKYRESLLHSYRSSDIPESAPSQTSTRSSYSRGDSWKEDPSSVSGDLTRSSTAPSFVTRQLRSRDPSHEEVLEPSQHPALDSSVTEQGFIEARPSSSLSDVSGAAATVVTLKNAISEVLGTEERVRPPTQKGEREDSEEGPFTITFRNVTEAGTVRSEFPANSEENFQSTTDHGGAGVAGTDSRTAQFEPNQLTDALYNQFLSSTNTTQFNTSSISSSTYIPTTLPYYPSTEPPTSSRLVRFAESKSGTELSGSSDSSLVVECGDSDRHSGSDIYLLDDSSYYSGSRGLVDENYSGAKLVVAHISDVESLLQKRSLSSSRSFEDPQRALSSSRSFDDPHATLRRHKAHRLQKQQSEVIPDYAYYESDHRLKSQSAFRQQQIDRRARPGEVVQRRFLYSEELIPEASYQESVEVDPRYSSFPDDSSFFITSPTTTITSSSSVARVQLSSSSQTLRQSSLEMTVAQAMNDTSFDVRNGSATTPPAMDGKHWGPERKVEVRRDENGSLGISIVGGKVDLSWSGSSVTGIFVKNVLANSPAGRSGLLKTGDRILEVENVDLRSATHEKAVEVIKKTGNPVTFIVQSLVQWNASSVPGSRDVSRLGIHAPEAVPPARTPTPELIQPGISDQKKQEIQEKIQQETQQAQLTQQDATAALLRRREEEDLEEETSSEEEDTRELQGRTNSKMGVEIDRASAGALKRSKADRDADSEEEDQFGYTQKKVQKKYKSSDGSVELVDLQKGANGLGLSLAGHKDRTQMSVYVCGMNPNGNAFKDGRIRVGDEILEVNGYVVEGRSHLNASTIFKGIPGPSIKIILRRKKTGLQDMAVKPLTHFPVTLDDETPEEKYARFKGLTKFVMKKGQSGLGIMIIEGKHAEYGNGIFISDLQEGSVAAEAGLMVGDMILSVNKEEMIGIDYEMAAAILKKTEGVINMFVANAARVTTAPPSAPTPVPSSAPTPVPTKTAPPTPAKNAEPKKPEIPPKPSILPKPPIPAKPSSIHSSQHPHLNLTSTNAPSITTPTISPSSSYTATSTTNTSAATPNTPNLSSPAEGFSPHATSHSALHSPSSSLRTPSGTSAHSVEDSPADPSMAEIKPGKETTIEIVKEKMGLGLSIVGGTDTLLGAIIIHEVYPDGAAAKDGRLKPGDQILEVNNENFRVITHQKALSVLRQTPSKVKMVVYREEGTQKEEDLYDVISVQLTKKSGKGLGLSIVGRKNGPGVFISDLVPGGVAESDSRLMQGDQILEVNDKELRTATQEQAAAILKCAPASVSMKIGRLKPGKKVAQTANTTWPVTISEGSPRTPSSLSPEFPFPHPPLLLSPHSIPQLQSSQQNPAKPPSPQISPPPLRTVVLERGDDGLGFSIVGGFGSNLGDLPIYVKSVFERGAASREGSLRRGDQILQVNGHSLTGLTHAQAVGILKDAKGTVTLTILPSK